MFKFPISCVVYFIVFHDVALLKPPSNFKFHLLFFTYVVFNLDPHKDNACIDIPSSYANLSPTCLSPIFMSPMSHAMVFEIILETCFV